MMIAKSCCARSSQDKTAKKVIYLMQEPEQRLTVKSMASGRVADGGTRWNREIRRKAELEKGAPISGMLSLESLVGPVSGEGSGIYMSEDQR